MYIQSYYADLDVTPEEIRRNTGFAIKTEGTKPAMPPTRTELKLLREKIDPEGIFF